MSERMQTIHAWLAEVLGREDFSLAPASADASFRRYFRVRAAACSWVLMDAPPGQEDCTQFVEIAALLRAASVRVPTVHAADLSLGLLLLDDLGNELFLAHLSPDGADALYDDALRTLVRMQRGVDAAALPAYDHELLWREMTLFPDWLLARHLGHAVDPADRLLLDETFEFLADAALAQPQVFVHRDYHSRNLMRLPEGNPGVLDFQDAVRGPITYDLVSLLRDAYVEWPERRVYGWVERFGRMARDVGLPVAEPAALVREFDLMGVQRHLKVAGIFARLFHRDGKHGYLADIPLVIDYLLGVASRYEELEPLVQLCERLGLKAAVLAANRRELATNSPAAGTATP